MRDFSFGNLLTSYRTRLGLTQTEVAEALEISLRTYQGWENEERLPPNAMLQRIMPVFELSDAEADQLYRAAAQVAPELQILPFPRNPFFTGRERYLEQLDRDLKKSGAVAITQPISISGLGGIGKTQLALEYAHRCHPKVYRTVLWVNASDQATLEASYLSLAYLLNLPERDEREADRIVQAVKKWLEGHTSWLLVFDNADDLQLTRTFLPTKPRGDILLTTRSQIRGTIAAPMVLEAMEPEEGLRFLLRRSGLLKPGTERESLAVTLGEAAAQLVELLGGHPLALDQVGAYLEETGTSFDAYLRLYHEQRRLLLEKRGSLGDEHPESVVVTFEVCFQRACTMCPPAADVLSFCAFLHPDAIPEEIFSHNERLKLSLLEFDDAIRALRRYSLIKRNAQDRLLSVHRLVQAVRKDGMDQETIREWVEQAVLAVNAAFPHAEYGTWAQCERLLPLALAAAEYTEQRQMTFEEAGRLLFETASYLQDRARYGEAEPLFQRALHIWEQQLGPQHLQLAHPLNGLAILYSQQGKYAEAEPLFQRALHIREQQLGPQHPLVATSLLNLANLYWHQGKYAEAEPLYQRALHIREQQLGPQHPKVAHPLTGLANLYSEQGKYAEAEPLFQRALRIWEQLGPQHPQLATSLHNLANLYSDQGKYTEAEPLFQRALHVWEQLGPQHPLVAYPLNGLAILYSEQGKYEQAEPLFQRVLHIREQQLGPQHPETAETIHDLAAFHQMQGNHQEALSLYQRALAIREQVLGPAHPKTRATHQRLTGLKQSVSQETVASPQDDTPPEQSEQRA